MKSFIDLTERFEFKPDIGAMLADLGRLKGDEWVDHYDATLSTDYVALTLYSIDGREDGPEAQRHLPLSEYGRYRPTDLLKKLPYFAELLDNFKCAKGRVRISKLGPGASIGEHRDVRHEAAAYAFGQVRLHIPIKTNPDVYFWIDRKRCRMDAGRIYYGDFTKRHYVENKSTEVRSHLVMDFALNDWLRERFPPFSTFEEMSVVAARTFVPVYWQGLKTKGAVQRALWRSYDGSSLQALYRRLRSSASSSEGLGRS